MKRTRIRPLGLRRCGPGRSRTCARGFVGRCLSPLSYRGRAGTRGLEPLTCRVGGGCSGPAELRPVERAAVALRPAAARTGSELRHARDGRAAGGGRRRSFRAPAWSRRRAGVRSRAPTVQDAIKHGRRRTRSLSVDDLDRYLPPYTAELARARRQTLGTILSRTAGKVPDEDRRSSTGTPGARSPSSTRTRTGSRTHWSSAGCAGTTASRSSPTTPTRSSSRTSRWRVIGAISVPVNFNFTAREVRYVLEDSGATAAIVEDALVDTFGAARAATSGCGSWSDRPRRAGRVRPSCSPTATRRSPTSRSATTTRCSCSTRAVRRRRRRARS